MISLSVVLCVLIFHAWMPVTAHARLAAFTGRGTVVPVETHVQRWRSAKRAQVRGQAATTRQLQSLIGELSAGIITSAAFVHVLGDEYLDPDALRASPPTADAHIWSDVAHVWAASERAGLSMSLALRRIHAYALVDQEVAREVQANTAAPRLAVLTLAALPVLAWSTAGATGARPIEFLYSTPAGWICVAIGALLFTGAILWMRALTRRALA